MKSALLLSALSLCAASAPAGAEDKPPEIVARATLDMDGDGKLDLAVLTTKAGATSSDLAIYLGAGDATPDGALPPSLLKRDIGGRVVRELSVRGKALILRDSMGGGRDDSETILTILHRGGAFIVAGYTLNWDTRRSAGSCDVNFVTGKALVSHGVNGKPRRVRGRFSPISLARWTDADAPAPCRRN